VKIGKQGIKPGSFMLQHKPLRNPIKNKKLFDFDEMLFEIGGHAGLNYRSQSVI